jgi:polysaccharide pyruvyl transferase WcaK-like protein
MKSKYPKAEFTCLCDVPKEYEKMFGIKSYYAPYALPFKGIRWINTLIKSFRFFFWAVFYKLLGINLFLNKEELKSLQFYKEADIVISAGGNALTDDYFGTNYFFLETWWIIKTILNKPLLVYAYSVGPYKHWYYKMLAKYVLDKVDFITLREDISKSVVKELNLKCKVISSADSAFLLENPKPFHAKQKTIGISVREWKYDKKLIAEFCDYIVDKYKVRILFVSTCFEGGVGYTDDTKVADEIIGMMRNDAYILRQEKSPSELKSIIGSCKLFIGMRAHAVLFALSMGVPTIALSYEFKSLMGLSEYAVYAKDTNITQLKNLFDKAWVNRSQSIKALKNNLPIVRKRALVSGEIAEKFINGWYQKREYENYWSGENENCY